MQSNYPKSNRARLLLTLGLTLLFLAAIGELSLRLIDYFLQPPSQKIAVLPQDTAPKTPLPLSGPLGRFPPGAPVFSGHVIDALTKEPIASFQVQVGEAIISNPPSIPYFGVNPPQTFTNGTYHTSTYGGGPMVQFYLRVNAPGHRPALSPMLPASATQDFALQPSPELLGQILAPGGSPADRAFVVITVPGFPLSIDLSQAPSSILHAATDATGRYSFPPQSGPLRLVAFGDQGLADLTQDASAPAAKWTVHLSPWAKIHGRLTVAGKPAPNQQVQITTSRQYDPGNPNITETATAPTDAGGNFLVDRVPPGLITIGRIFQQKIGDQSRPFLTQTVDLSAAPGQSLTVNLGGAGRPVIGRLVFPPGAGSIAGYQLFQDSAASTDHTYALEISPGGAFRIPDVLPGQYHGWISLMFNPTLGGMQLQPAAFTFTMPPVPSGYSPEPLHIGDIKLTQ